MKTNVGVTALVVFSAAACTQATPDLSEAERSVIVRSVDSATQAFADAERARDPERVLAHIAPEFYMYNDGIRVGYDSVSNQIRQTFPGLLEFATRWHDVEVTPLGRRHAVVSFRFTDRITDKDGTAFGAVGPTTLVWERRGIDWLIIYADADHYPEPTP